MSKQLSQVTKEKISKTMTGRKVFKETIEKRKATHEKKKRSRKRIEYYEKMIVTYQDLISRLRIQSKLKPLKIGNDKIYIPYHPDRNKEEREKLMNEFEKQGWEYVDARRIWDAPFNRWLYFWILKQ